MKSRYQVTRPLPTATGSGNYALHNAAVAYINRRWMADSVVITRDEVEAHLRTLPAGGRIPGHFAMCSSG
jgi:hypothetical protein